MKKRDNKKTICFAIHSLQLGGMERVMTVLANYLALKDHLEIHIILYGMNREVFFSVSPDIIIHKPSFSFSSYPRIISTLKTLFFIRKTVKFIQPEAVLSFGELWNSFVLLALFGLDFPICISDRCQPDKSFGSLQDALRKWLYPKARGIVAQTSKAKRIYEEQQLNTNIRVIGNPVYPLSPNGKTEKQNIILSVGRLIASKHHDRLIRIFKEVYQPGWKLVIAGGDALKQSGMYELTQLIAGLGMENRVELAGEVLNIDTYYHQSKIFAFTSSSEGFPNVLVEAMAAGLPVISYDCVAGPSDMIENDTNGFLIPLFDDDLYAQKLRTLMHDQDLRTRMGGEAKQMAQKFEVDKIGEEYYLFLRGLI